MQIIDLPWNCYYFVSRVYCSRNNAVMREFGQTVNVFKNTVIKGDPIDFYGFLKDSLEEIYGRLRNCNYIDLKYKSYDNDGYVFMIYATKPGADTSIIEICLTEVRKSVTL